MFKKPPTKKIYCKQNLPLLGTVILIIAIILIVFFGDTGTLFKGQLTSNPELISKKNCKSLTLKSIPFPLYSDTTAAIIVESDPPEWEGEMKISASSGSFTDTNEEEGSYIMTKEKLLNYSGGTGGTLITAQATNPSNQNCLATIQIQEQVKTACIKIMVSSNPSPLPPNQSTELIIISDPMEWKGSYLLKAESGKFLLTSGDNTALGENTNTLITKLNKINYTGGQVGESITIQALGETNKNCTTQIKIIGK